MGLLSICLAGLFGCAGSLRGAPVQGARWELFNSYAHSLAAAGEDPSDEIGGLLDWEPGKPLEPPPFKEPVARRRPRTRRGRFGVRCALVVPGGPGWNAGVRAGAYYRTRLFNGAPVELGLDYAALEDEDGYVSSEFLYLRADVDLGRKAARFHPLAGVELVYERAELRVRNETRTPYAVGLNVGVGTGAPSGRWDVRVLYSWLPGSTNVKGGALVAVSFGF